MRKFSISPARERAYRAYLKSPKARVERILDQLDDERRAFELKESDRVVRQGWRRLARMSLRSQKAEK